MRRLTVLLDPGRLKRRLGPNRRLGPPLTAGHDYTLVVDGGMRDRLGQRLSETRHHRFHTTAPVRRRIDVAEWACTAPLADGLQPLLLGFPRPLDWSMLSHSIRIDLADGSPIVGRTEIGRDERQWSFTPAAPWVPGHYRIVVDPTLEDVCGNDLLDAFDRVARRGEPHRSAEAGSIPFSVV